MNPQIIAQLDAMLQKLWAENRTALLEPEIYQLLQLLQVATPKFTFIQSPEQICPEVLSSLPGDTIVTKIVSPEIFHKTDVGGVRIVPKNLSELQQSWQTFAQICEQQHTHFTGMIVCELVKYQPGIFATEILFGIRWSKDFGHLITVGLGGVETDLLGQIVKENANVQNELVVGIDRARFQNQLATTLMYQKLAGKTRGGKRWIQDEDFFNPLWQLVEFAQYYSPWGAGKFLLEEMEFNPMVVAQGQLLALDAKIRFSALPTLRRKPDITKIHKLLQPSSIALVGASSKGMNMGRIILNNILTNGFPKERLYVVKDGLDTLDGCKCVPQVASLPEKTDVFIIAVNAAETPKIIQELLQSNRTHSIIIIPGGMGEKEGEGQKIEANIKKIVSEMPDAPVLVGGNCLGIRSLPGKYDTFFIPEYKLPRGKPLPHKMAMISQSGAFIITKISKFYADFEYAISTGNQIDLATSDYLGYFKDDPNISLLAFYVEGFGYLDGLAFVQYAREAVANGKKIICYKAGKTAQGQSAALGHTASIAGEYQVTRNLLKNAGVFLIDSFQEFEESIQLFTYLEGKKIRGNRLGLISNAGFETVGMADNSSPIGAPAIIPQLKPETVHQIEQIYSKGKLQEIANIRNPLDITPSANDMVYESCTRILLESDYLDAVLVSIVPLTPATNTLAAGPQHNENIELETSLPNRLIRLAKASDKPVLVVVDSGHIYDPMVEMLQHNNIPVFRSADRAVSLLSRYLCHCLAIEKK